MFKKLVNGFIFSLFAISVCLIVTEPSKLYIYFSTDTIISIILIVLGAFILGLILSYLLAKCEKKKEAGIFSYGWLIVWNLWAALLLYIAVVVLSVVFSFILIQFFDAQSETSLGVIIVALYGLWIVPLSVFILFFIPSLFFCLFYSNKKLLKIIRLMFITLSLCFFSFSIAMHVTCEFNQDYVCVANNAIKYKNPQLCEKASEYYDQDLCYLHVSEETNDVSLCDKISIEDFRSMCIREIAIKMNNPKLCELVKSKEREFDKEDCYTRVRMFSK